MPPNKTQDLSLGALLHPFLIKKAVRMWCTFSDLKIAATLGSSLVLRKQQNRVRIRNIQIRFLRGFFIVAFTLCNCYCTWCSYTNEQPRLEMYKSVYTTGFLPVFTGWKEVKEQSNSKVKIFSILIFFYIWCLVGFTNVIVCFNLKTSDQNLMGFITSLGHCDSQTAVL